MTVGSSGLSSIIGEGEEDCHRQTSKDDDNNLR